jgi:serine/threonine protein kinase
VHRDIKPENLLCAFDDASTIKIIDFGIYKPFSRGQPSKYDPLKDRRHIVGSLYWASLTSHNGVGECTPCLAAVASFVLISIQHVADLAPRDDIESLAFVALFLLRGNLPWKPRPRLESQLHSQEVVRLMKLGCSGPILSTGFPNEFGGVLTYSRSLRFDQLPDYGGVRRSFASLANRLGYSPDSGPLNWTPCYPEITNLILDEPEILISDEEEDDASDDDLGEDSYYGMDIDIWERQGERDKDVTLCAIQKAELDSITLRIVEVQNN